MKAIRLIIALAIGISFSAFHSSVVTAAARLSSATDPTFQKQLSGVLKAYIPLKNALVASDVAKVKAAAQSLKASLGKVDMKLLKGEAHLQWMAQLKTITEHLQAISKTDNLAQQREHFAPLSEALHQSLKVFGTGGTVAYYQYCPMALNKGAYWLSESKPIQNPYFGKQMPVCGETKEELKN